MNIYLNIDGAFLWFEDDILLEEFSALATQKAAKSLVEVDLRKDPHQLQAEQLRLENCLSQ